LTPAAIGHRSVVPDRGNSRLDIEFRRDVNPSHTSPIISRRVRRLSCHRRRAAFVSCARLTTQ